MIFRITVNDNDFTVYLKEFAGNLFDRLYFAKNKTGDMSYSEWYKKCYISKKEIQKLMNPNITSSLTNSDKLLLCEAVSLEWCDYVNSLGKDDITKEYLKSHFTVSVSFKFVDKWENGEVVYYFTTNQKWILQ